MAKGYYFYMGKYLLPIPPDKMEIKIKNANETVTMINQGEINILKTPELTDIEFECRIPQTQYPFAAYKSGFKGASYFLNYFEKLKTSKKPFQFIVSRYSPSGGKYFNTNIKVSLENYTISEQAKNGTDVMVKIKLKQYRDYATKSIVIKENKKETTQKQTKQQETRPKSTTNKEITIGSEVILNGRLYGTSYGESPGITKSNFRGKVNFINLKGTHPYHITTMSGAWLGWVLKSSVKGV